ncbi:M36 family metallopeptidase, partial [Salmonella enterica]|uniref:M36 family metallopeptidase n=1 Tax=Salmonella enterica TaxID=28901 RepID=UPI003D2BCBBA
VVQNDPTANPITMGNADVPTLPINIPINTSTLYNTPAVMIRKDDGDRVRALLAAGTPVTMHVKRDVSIDYDGTLDNQIIAHEYFHYVSNRL